MKRNRILPICLITLVIITCTIGLLRNSAYTEPAENSVLLCIEDTSAQVPYDQITVGSVTGELVTGKGEHKSVDAKGIELSMLLAEYNIDPAQTGSATVTAADSYSAIINAAEIMEPGKVFLILQDGSLRLVVFGDTDSKRSVRDVMKIEVFPENAQ